MISLSLAVLAAVAAAAMGNDTCSTRPCVSTDYRSYARCLSRQCGPVCPSQHCGQTNCNTCHYNQQAPCCQSCCQQQQYQQQQSCWGSNSWPFIQCGGGCSGGGCLGGGGGCAGGGCYGGGGYGYVGGAGGCAGGGCYGGGGYGYGGGFYPQQGAYSYG